VNHHPLSRLLLVDPDRIAARLRELDAHRAATSPSCSSSVGGLPRTPNVWQVTLGVLRMWHRVLFRSETIGQSRDFPVRDTWRAKLLRLRPIRFPFLLKERAVAPLDFSGLASSPDRVVSHLLGAHHDGIQFLYDLELLASVPGALDRVAERAHEVIAEPHARRSRWLRDLVVYERYHEHLAEAVDAFRAGRFEAPAEALADPDLSLSGYLAWCARQPPTPDATWSALRAGRYSVATGVAS
jgi:hypothetical protein